MQPKNNGFTPAFVAAGSGHLECLKTLIEANPAAVMQPNNNGATPAFIAAQEGQLECLNALHAAGEKMPEDRTFFSDEAKSLLNTLRNTHAVTALSFLREGSAVTNEALDTIQSEI